MILDIFDRKVAGIRIDAAVVQATQVGRDFVEGYITACHGLDMEFAKHLDRAQLRALGVGFPHTPLASAGKSSGRVVHLTEDGRIQGVNM